MVNTFNLHYTCIVFLITKMHNIPNIIKIGGRDVITLPTKYGYRLLLRKLECQIKITTLINTEKYLKAKLLLKLNYLLRI